MGWALAATIALALWATARQRDAALDQVDQLREELRASDREWSAWLEVALACDSALDTCRRANE